MDGEHPDKVKAGCCTTNKCIVLFLVLVLAGCGVVVVLTFAVPGVRSEVRDPVAERKWWQNTIVYQIYPRSFQDSDGDGVGDLQGINSRLHYFKDLGVDCIWLSPFYTSPMRDFGYDVENYTDVDPLFGNMTDFEDMIAEAHRQDIKVIVDFVPNHSSNQCLWFELSRQKQGKYTDYYIWANGTDANTPPNNWESVFEGSAWEYDSVRQQFFYHAFLDSQPDLNFRNKDVREEMKNVLRFWCDKGVDGIRIDAIPHLFEVENISMNEPPGPTNGFDTSIHPYIKNQPEIFEVVKEWRAVLDEFEAKDGKSRFLVAETVGIPHADRLKYYEAGSVPFFFDLIAAKDRCGGTPQCLLDIIHEGLNLTDGLWPNFVIGNHDNARIASRMGSRYVDAMNMLLLTLPGTPTSYYGEELGMHNTGDLYIIKPPKDPYAITSGDYSKSRDPERSPMQWNITRNAGFTTGNPWLPVNWNYTKANVETEKGDVGSSYNIYKRLADIRRRPAFQSLNIDLPTKAIDALVYTRGDNREKYAVALNLGTKHTIVNIDVGYETGMISMSTLPRPSRNIKMSQVELAVGEGLIIKLAGDM